MSLPIRVGHLGKVEATALLTVVGITNVFLNYPIQLVIYGRQAAWMIPLFSMVVVLVLCLLLGRAYHPLQDDDFLSLFEGRVAKAVGCILSIILILYFYLTTASEIRQFAETLLGTVLSRSPLSYVSIPLLLVIVYLAFAGIESISRVAWILSSLFLFILIVILVGDYPYIHFQYITPLWGPGIDQLVGNGLLFTTAFPNLLLLVILSGAVREKSDMKFIGIWSTVIIGVVYSIVALFFTATFPTQLSEHMSFPVYQMARIVSFGRYLERLESLFIFLWVACAVMKMAIGVWACAFLTARIFRMPVYQPLVCSTAVVVYALAFIPRSYPETISWDASYLMRFGPVCTLIIPVLALVMRILRGGKHREKKLRRAS